MSIDAILNVFQGFQAIGYEFATNPGLAITRIGLVFLGFLLIYLGRKGILEPLLMIPMGLGMATINVSLMFFDPINMVAGLPVDPTKLGNLFVDPSVVSNDHIMTLFQINWLQPIYNLTFGNGLIACLVFMGIGSLLDVGYVMRKPFQSIIIALFAELGTILTFPVAQLFGYNLKQAASIATVGGADGPMVLFTSLKLAPELFVPIAVVAYLYLGIAYGVFPYLVKWTIPKKLQAIEMPDSEEKEFSSAQKMLFAVVACVVLSLILPVASPLIFSLFFGVVIRESGVKQYVDLLQGPILYVSTLFLGLVLGILCDASTIASPKVLPLLILGVFALLLSAVGGILGGYFMYFITGKKFNPVVGIAGVSCVPTTAKVCQKIVSKANPHAIVLPDALGVNISGVITTAIIAGIYCSFLS
jgi:carboxybiotin decarboxylase